MILIDLIVYVALKSGRAKAIWACLSWSVWRNTTSEQCNTHWPVRPSWNYCHGVPGPIVDRKMPSCPRGFHGGSDIVFLDGPFEAFFKTVSEAVSVMPLAGKWRQQSMRFYLPSQYQVIKSQGTILCLGISSSEDWSVRRILKFLLKCKKFSNSVYCFKPLKELSLIMRNQPFPYLFGKCTLHSSSP